MWKNEKNEKKCKKCLWKVFWKCYSFKPNINSRIKHTDNTDKILK